VERAGCARSSRCDGATQSEPGPCSSPRFRGRHQGRLGDLRRQGGAEQDATRRPGGRCPQRSGASGRRPATRGTGARAGAPPEWGRPWAGVGPSTRPGTRVEPWAVTTENCAAVLATMPPNATGRHRLGNNALAVSAAGDGPIDLSVLTHSPPGAATGGTG